MLTYAGVCWRVLQRKFQLDMQLLNSVLDELILNVVSTENPTDMDALMNKDYDNVLDASLLRFLVDVRGAGTTYYLKPDYS